MAMEAPVPLDPDHNVDTLSEVQVGAIDVEHGRSYLHHVTNTSVNMSLCKSTLWNNTKKG